MPSSSASIAPMETLLRLIHGAEPARTTHSLQADPSPLGGLCFSGGMSSRVNVVGNQSRALSIAANTCWAEVPGRTGGHFVRAVLLRPKSILNDRAGHRVVV